MTNDLFSRTGYKKLDDMYEVERAYVFAVIQSKVRDQAITDELTQDAFIRVMGHIDEYSPQSDDIKSSLHSWLATIARNVAFSYLRRRKMEQSYLSEEDHRKDDDPLHGAYGDCDSEELLRQKQVSERTIKAIDDIADPGIRETARLRYVEGRSYNEISGELAIPKGTVMSRLFRARGKIKDDEGLASYIND